MPQPSAKPNSRPPNLQVIAPQPAELAVPHSVEAEEALLGSLLIDRDTVAKIAPHLKPDHFFSQERAMVYQAILNLYSDGTPADMVTLRNELRTLDALGESDGQVKPAYLLRLLQNTPSPVHILHYMQIVLKHWLARQLIAECSATVGAAYQGDGLAEPGELLAAHTLRLQGLATSLSSLQADYFLPHEQSFDYPLTLDSATTDPWDKTPNSRPLLRFGWEAFDGKDWAQPPSLCLFPATLTTVLARTGGGKTIAAMQIADANAQAGLNVLYFHVELNQSQMLARRYCRLTGVPVMSQLLNRLSAVERQDLLIASDQVTRWSGRVDFVHCPNWSAELLVQEIKARHYALLAAKGQGYDLVVLDYLQRLGRPEHLGRSPEHEALAYNVRTFSDCANALNITALMTSQVGRSDTQPYDPRT